MKILCEVNQAECLRHGIDAPSSTIRIEVDPKSLTQEQRDFVAGELHNGVRFPKSDEFQICPPTYEGFIAAVNYGLEKNKRPDILLSGGAQNWEKIEKELKATRQSLIKAAVDHMEKERIGAELEKL